VRLMLLGKLRWGTWIFRMTGSIYL